MSIDIYNLLSSINIQSKIHFILFDFLALRIDIAPEIFTCI